MDTEFVMVECISTYRMRYMVEVPAGKTEWALDIVTMEEAVEFSQKHIGEHIISHRVVTEEYVLSTCDIDNDYAKSWSDEKKMEVFVTPWLEEEVEKVEHTETYFDTTRNK